MANDVDSTLCAQWYWLVIRYFYWKCYKSVHTNKRMEDKNGHFIEFNNTYHGPVTRLSSTISVHIIDIIMDSHTTTTLSSQNTSPRNFYVNQREKLYTRIFRWSTLSSKTSFNYGCCHQISLLTPMFCLTFVITFSLDSLFWNVYTLCRCFPMHTLIVGDKTNIFLPRDSIDAVLQGRNPTFRRNFRLQT